MVREGVGVSGLIEPRKSDLLLGFLTPAETAVINGFSKKSNSPSWWYIISAIYLIIIYYLHMVISRLDSNSLPYDCSPLIPLKHLVMFILRLSDIVFLICIEKLSDFDRYVSFTSGFI
ncbi:unnamed protein product [Adineta ricciae]|uniref:Uncharacterized protein n=1 Tax=Adineta ricciae TaxID=249248 RepID=A0A816E5D3_ADIRI|nr:unnamed protein product [Adineta ricciae]